MKNIIAIFIAGLFIMSAFGAVALPKANLRTTNENDAGKLDYTHTVFVEVATAQVCPYWGSQISLIFIFLT